jgi:hypothetical protein
MQLFQRQQQQQQQQQLAEAATEPSRTTAQLAGLRLTPGSSSQHAAAAAGGGGGALNDLLASVAAAAPPPPPAQQQQPQQEEAADLGLGQAYWYAVGRKVTGDLNVPAGKVSFVVDISSRSTEHAGEVLALKLGYDTDVALHKAGTRRLVERVGGPWGWQGGRRVLGVCLCSAQGEGWGRKFGNGGQGQPAALVLHRAVTIK